METVVVRPRNSEELQLVTQVLKRMKIKAEVIEPIPSKSQRKQAILDSVERGAKDVAAALRGEIKLRSARDVLDEL